MRKAYVTNAIGLHQEQNNKSVLNIYHDLFCKMMDSLPSEEEKNKFHYEAMSQLRKITGETRLMTLATHCGTGDVVIFVFDAEADGKHHKLEIDEVGKYFVWVEK